MKVSFSISDTRPHSFHIPVMGTGFSIDTPLKVAKYGIDSVVSLVDDVLTEQMRRFHANLAGKSYVEIPDDAEDVRAKRITAYLDLLDVLVREDTEKLRISPFEPQSEITRYFELLPEGDDKELYRKMLGSANEADKLALQATLRTKVKPGRIDVNIMTKLDTRKTPEVVAGDAVLALQGFGRSKLESGLVLSAGLNPKLYGQLASFPDFFPSEDGPAKKQVVLKVSDYRSALIQAKFLARSGVWISEFRVEASINCGGHAFSTDGQLLGPILQQFKDGRETLQNTAAPIYRKALLARGLAESAIEEPPLARLTVQGGIGTHAEDRFLQEKYDTDGTGWATPFMLVPEVTRIDDEHLARLAKADDDDVFLSKASPLGLPFWLLKGCSSELDRISRIKEGAPGRACRKGYSLNNTEFTKNPICPSSRVYQKKKLEQIEQSGMTQAQISAERDKVLAKVCLCHDLAGNATVPLGLESDPKAAVPCGPNIVNFHQVATLEQMIDHIYGRGTLLNGKKRPHMFIRELELYIDLLKGQLEASAAGQSDCQPDYFARFASNLRKGVAYYQSVAQELSEAERVPFEEGLREQTAKLDQVSANLPE